MILSWQVIPVVIGTSTNEDSEQAEAQQPPLAALSATSPVT
jgi:hypothetical protein